MQKIILSGSYSQQHNFSAELEPADFPHEYKGFFHIITPVKGKIISSFKIAARIVDSKATLLKCLETERVKSVEVQRRVVIEQRLSKALKEKELA